MIFFTSLLVFFNSLLIFFRTNNRFFYVIFFLILVCFATFRDGSSMPDYSTYVGLYSNVVNNNSNYFIELSFLLIAKVSHFFISNEPLVLFFVYAFVAVFIKFKVIKYFSSFPIISILVYSSNYFILHEMIQIRAGVAVGFIFLSLVFVYKKNLFLFILCIACATFFHYSSILFFLFYFLPVYKFSLLSYFVILFSAYSINYLLVYIDLVSILRILIPIPDLIEKIILYSSKDSDIKVNVFGIYILSRILILGFFLYHYKILMKKNIFYPMFMNIYMYGIFLYIALSSFPHISVRLGYTLMFSEVLLIPLLIYLFNNKIIAKFLVIAFVILNLTFNIFFTSYFNWTYS